MSKKTWERPELVILYRGKPEENVLVECRANATADLKGGTQTATGHGCQADPGGGKCNACQSLGGGIS